jgi:hypothetical protein
MNALLLQRVGNRSPVQGADDYDVLGPEGWVIGRIFLRRSPSAEEVTWIWTMVYGFDEERTPTHGQAPTREAALRAFAKSWSGES